MRWAWRRKTSGPGLRALDDFRVPMGILRFWCALYLLARSTSYCSRVMSFVG